MNKEYKDKVFRLSGKEGSLFKDLMVRGNSWSGGGGEISFYVKVVGFEDKVADGGRSWGHRTFKDFIEKPKVKYRYKTNTVVIEPTLRNVLIRLFSRRKK